MSWTNNAPILDCANRPTHKLISGSCSIEYNRDLDRIPLGPGTIQAIKEGLITKMPTEYDNYPIKQVSKMPIIKAEPLHLPKEDTWHAAFPDIRKYI